jgi:hypothetical protein
MGEILVLLLAWFADIHGTRLAHRGFCFGFGNFFDGNCRYEQRPSHIYTKDPKQHRRFEIKKKKDRWKKNAS